MIIIPNRSPLDMRLNTVFELRGMPTEVLRQMAIKRGIRANKGRVHLMRAIYWDIVRQDEAHEEQAQMGHRVSL